MTAEQARIIYQEAEDTLQKCVDKLGEAAWDGELAKQVDRLYTVWIELKEREEKENARGYGGEVESENSRHCRKRNRVF